MRTKREVIGNKNVDNERKVNRSHSWVTFTCTFLPFKSKCIILNKWRHVGTRPFQKTLKLSHLPHEYHFRRQKLQSLTKKALPQIRDSESSIHGYREPSDQAAAAATQHLRTDSTMAGTTTSCAKALAINGLAESILSQLDVRHALRRAASVPLMVSVHQSLQEPPAACVPDR